jgi:hypothetical protein
MTSASQVFLRPATFEDRRFCPYHGGFITLAECSIVATNEEYLEAEDDGAARTDVKAVLGGDSPGSAPRRRRNRSKLSKGERLESDIDGRARLLVHGPPRPSGEQRRGFFGRARPEPLPLPAELAVDFGGARCRPARACPQCRHPLPEAIDTHDPMLIPLVGHTAASKTTTMAAFIDQLGEHGPHAFGVGDMGPTEGTSARLTETMQLYRSGKDVRGTEAQAWILPMEFFAEPEDGEPAILFFHDVAGEDVMEANRRLIHAPFVLWADAILFIYNPEASPHLRPPGHSEQMDAKARDIEQSAVLNGLLNDLKANPRRGANGRGHDIPPLVVAVSKADLLPGSPPLDIGAAGEDAVKVALRELGDGSIVGAGERWPEVHWRFIAPQPPKSRPHGIVDLFSLLFSIVTR